MLYICLVSPPNAPLKIVLFGTNMDAVRDKDSDKVPGRQRLSLVTDVVCTGVGCF